MIRAPIVAHCGNQDCKRYTTATAIAYTGPDHMDPVLYRDIDFPLKPDGGGSEWACRDGDVWCPEHAQKKST